MDKSNIDASLYNEKSLYLLNIKELRDIGRKFGVPSPTTMKKRDLVDYILKVVYGEVEPPLRSSIGRPTASREFNIDGYIDKIKKNTNMASQLKEVRLDDESVAAKFLKFKACAPKNESNIGSILQRVVYREGDKCFLRKWQFIEDASDLCLPKSLADQLSLESFDVVEVIISQNGIKIISKNGKRISGNISSFEVNGETVLPGSRKVFHIRTKEKIEEEIAKIKENVFAQNLKLVYFGTKNQEDIDFFKANEKATEQSFKELMIFVQHIKKLVYENQDIIVIIEEMSLVENIFEALDEDISARAKQALNEEIKDFTKLGNILLTFHKIESHSYFS